LTPIILPESIFLIVISWRNGCTLPVDFAGFARPALICLFFLVLDVRDRQSQPAKFNRFAMRSQSEISILAK